MRGAAARDDVSFHELCNRWSCHAPQHVAVSTWPRLLTKNGVLLLECIRPCADELTHRTAEILSALPLVDGNRVERLSFRYVAPEKGAKRGHVMPFNAPRRKRAHKGKR